ncbi:PepSY domain-containing protein [Lederbergia citrea]|uniref:PepSY domain-containing protein n=1 Tax=Lederbergia citrea TaxID=2833581 RepID=UPI001BCA23FA|nr:PepSY domain-containing protein [Lederbergia citrea]MBS4205149.1 PepSY domain-containing protein [Lederbergia citrea]
MRNKKIRNILVAIGSVVLFVVVIWQILASTTTAAPLTETDAKKLTQEMYSGEIVDIHLINNVYQITLALDSKIYEIKIDRKTGEVFGISDKNPEQKVKEMPEAEIKNVILQHYPGKINKLERTVEREQVFYNAMIQTNEKQTILKISATTGAIVDKEIKVLKQPQETAKRMSEEEAIKLALKTVSGEVDDVELERSDGLVYYLIEIDRANDQEATVQINAITGEVMSVSWGD